LAEFATILGDFKLAVTVWETLRKEGKGGSVCASLLFAAILLIKARKFCLFCYPLRPISLYMSPVLWQPLAPPCQN
jgi:hypothetical protein